MHVQKILIIIFEVYGTDVKTPWFRCHVDVEKTSWHAKNQKRSFFIKDRLNQKPEGGEDRCWMRYVKLIRLSRWPKIATVRNHTQFCTLRIQNKRPHSCDCYAKGVTRFSFMILLFTVLTNWGTKRNTTFAIFGSKFLRNVTRLNRNGNLYCAIGKWDQKNFY